MSKCLILENVIQRLNSIIMMHSLKVRGFHSYLLKILRNLTQHIIHKDAALYSYLQFSYYEEGGLGTIFCPNLSNQLLYSGHQREDKL